MHVADMFNLQQLCGPPAHSFGRRDESFGPARVFGIKLSDRSCALPQEQEHVDQWSRFLFSLTEFNSLKNNKAVIK